jgi:heavy metal sensor kinase
VPIRLRLAILCALATAGIIAVGSILFVHSLASSLRASVDSGLSSRAATLSQTVSGATGGIDYERPGHIKLLRPRDLIAQVIDPEGVVVESSQLAGSAPLVDRHTQLAASKNAQYRTFARHSHRFRVLATYAPRRDGVWTVVVAGPLEAADDAVTSVSHALIVGGTIAVVLAGVGAWLLATAALRPVERMRRQAADISEHRPEPALEVPATRDEIAALGTTMNDLLDRLQRALSRQRAFVADAGHELRTPLAILRTELELANNPSLSSAELLEAVANAGVETERLAHLAEELLFLARTDDDQTALKFDVEPIVPFVSRSVQAFQARAAEESVEIDVVGDSTITAPVDAERFRRAVDNLLDNALRYAGTGTSVEIRTRRAGPDVVLEVRDRGPGFPEAFLPHAFERFRRADDARARGDGGSGLGLAIVDTVAQQHGGHAWATNRSGGGAVVAIQIPAAHLDGN